MLLPESMSRIVIVGSKSRLDETVDALYDLKAVHLIDYFNDSDAGFSIGAPRPYSSKASERLLKIRSAEKELDIDGKKETYPEVSANIREQIDSGRTEAVYTEVFRVVDERNQVAQALADLRTKKEGLEALSHLPLNLEAYSGYDTIVPMVGTIKSNPSSKLTELKDAEFFISDDSKLVAVFVKRSEKDEAQRILSEFGYAEMSVPEGTGTPKENLAEIDAVVQKLTAEMVTLDAKIAEIKEDHEAFLLATEEELMITVEKGEFPLRIGTSDFSFVIDAWVPVADVKYIEEGLRSRLGDSLYINAEENRGRDLHEEEKAEPRFKKTPTKFNNGNVGKHFEYPTTLVSVPRYQEIDPSTIMAVFFPLFFGFMVGDVGYALPFIILGAYGLKTAKSKEFRAIATVLFFGGLWAFLFGFFFFGEMLGMHFIGEFRPGEPALSITWEALLGVHMPEWFSDIMIDGHGISKTGAVGFLLKLSVYIGIFHLLFSYIVGFANVKIQHGLKEAVFEKGGWILSFIGVVLVCWALTDLLFVSPMPPVEGMLLYKFAIGAVLLVAGIAITWKKEKAQAILELPGIVGNILSYTRLAAIGMSKAGMALAFNYMALVMAIGFDGGFPSELSIIGLVGGIVIFIIGHLMIWVLAILSAGLHGLRLQYVESMNKFFTGGGEEYEPLSVKRKHTKIVETEV